MALDAQGDQVVGSGVFWLGVDFGPVVTIERGSLPAELADVVGSGECGRARGAIYWVFVVEALLDRPARTYERRLRLGALSYGTLLRIVLIERHLLVES